MCENKKTVVFGPFIGEFGWELMHWSMWVENVSRSHFSDYKRIVVSREGYSCLYPSADEFIPIPAQIVNLIKSPRNYISDGLFSGYPGTKTVWNFSIKTALKDISEARIPRRYSIDEPDVDLGLFQLLDSLQREIKKKQRQDSETIVFSPFLLNKFKGMTFGFNSHGDPKNLSQPSRIKPIRLENQYFEKLVSSLPKHQFSEEDSIAPDRLETICLFPRRRLDRRADKNLTEKDYISIISSLQERYRVAILGTPSGSYFSGGVPSGCLDLINLPVSIRLNRQIRILSESKFAVGGTSGALLLAARVGIPIKMLGPKSELKRLKSYDVLGGGVSKFSLDEI